MSLYLSGGFYDLSSDGQYYHQEGIIKLFEGWNPLYDPAFSTDTHVHWYLNHYPKASWVYSASLYKLTGRIEQSKVFNFLLIIATFFISFSAVSTLMKTKPFTSFMVSILLACNPVSIYQSLSFYCDGQLASLLTSLFLITNLLFIRKDKILTLIYFICIVLIVNVKFTGLVYALVLNVGVLMYFLIHKQKKKVFEVSKIACIAFLVGIFFVGHNPYVMNTIEHGNPFYSVLNRASDCIKDTRSMPESFFHMNWLARLFYSLFSESANNPTENPSNFKIPFTFAKNELRTFMSSDVRIGGFGPFFGGAVIIALISILFSLVLHKKRSQNFIIYIAFIFVSVLINPHGWWARLAPQLWIIPIIAAIMSLYIDKRALRYLGYSILCILYADIFLIGFVYGYGQYRDSRILKKQLDALACASQPVFVDFSVYKSNRIRLKEQGIRYIEVEKLPCSDFIELASMTLRRTRICLERKN